MTEFELKGETFIVDGDKIKSKLEDINFLLSTFALVNEGDYNLSAEYLIVSAAVSMGATVTSGDYLLSIGGSPNTVY